MQPLAVFSFWDWHKGRGSKDEVVFRSPELEGLDGGFSLAGGFVLGRAFHYVAFSHFDGAGSDWLVGHRGRISKSLAEGNGIV